MTWIAPEIARIDEPLVADERTMLEGWLDRHRTTLLHKCTGLTSQQLAERSTPPSNLSLLGLVRHMAEVERAWFRRRFRGEDIREQYNVDGNKPDVCFENLDADRAEADFATLTTEWEASRRAAEGASLDQTFTHPRHGEMSLRWVYVHMIEEYARHNGHADLIRERIDGVTGS